MCPDSSQGQTSRRRAGSPSATKGRAVWPRGCEVLSSHLSSRHPAGPALWKTGLCPGLGTRPCTQPFALEEHSGSSWLPLALQGPGAFQQVGQVDLNTKPGGARAKAQSGLPLVPSEAQRPLPLHTTWRNGPKTTSTTRLVHHPPVGPAGVMKPREHPLPAVCGVSDSGSDRPLPAPRWGVSNMAAPEEKP